MNVDLAQTANPLEWAYTLTGLVCFVITMALLRKAQDRRRFLKAEHINGGIMQLAILRVQDRWIMAIIQAGATLLGFYFLLQPPGRPTTPITQGGIIFALYMLMTEVLLLVKTLNGYMRETRAERSAEYTDPSAMERYAAARELMAAAMEQMTGKREVK